MKRVSFVIPCYRSACTIKAVITELRETMSHLSGYQYEVVLVNDCSPDDTFSVITDIAKESDNVVGLDLARNFGQHAALMAGFRQVSGDIVVCLDDDGQTPVNEVGKLLEKIEEGYDVVYASYENKKHSGFRNWGSKINGIMTEVLLNKPRDLSITSYFAMRRFIMDEMIRYEHCYPYVIGLVLRTTKRICNVGVNHRARESGRSGYTIQKLIGLWMNGFTSFSVKPLRIASILGITTASSGFLYLLYVLISYFLRKTSLLGWSSTMAVLLVLGGVILLVLGLIGEYIGRIFMCTNAAPQYVLREVVTCRDRDEKHEK